MCFARGGKDDCKHFCLRRFFFFKLPIHYKMFVCVCVCVCAVGVQTNTIQLYSLLRSKWLKPEKTCLPRADTQ